VEETNKQDKAILYGGYCMNHLKSSLQDLRKLFEQSITIKDLAEPLVSFDTDYPSRQCRSFMQKKAFDVIGVRKEGLVAGYARKSDLHDGKLGDHFLQFEQKNLCLETTPLTKIFKVLMPSPRVFVLAFGKVCGIITRADLQKAPVRMWLFGLISLIEMQFSRIVREYYSEDSWKTLISSKQLKQAEEWFERHKTRNLTIDLIECLSLKDKFDIIEQNEKLRKRLKLESKKTGEQHLIPSCNLSDS